jgi:hypothetical protein
MHLVSKIVILLILCLLARHLIAYSYANECRFLLDNCDSHNNKPERRMSEVQCCVKVMELAGGLDNLVKCKETLRLYPATPFCRSLASMPPPNMTSRNLQCCLQYQARQSVHFADGDEAECNKGMRMGADFCSAAYSQ